MTTSTTYLDLENGVPTQQTAVISSAGVGDANKIPRLDTTGKLAQNMMPTGIVADTKDFATLETLGLGNLEFFLLLAIGN